MREHENGAVTEHETTLDRLRRTRDEVRQRERAEARNALREIRDALAGAAIGAGAHEFLTWITGS